MNRRRFCRVAALGALGSALGLKATAATAAPGLADSAAAPRRCRVTVVRRCCFVDLQSCYLDNPDEGPCRAFTEGQTFQATTSEQAPRGFCPVAWECISRHVQAVLDGPAPQPCGVTLDPEGAVVACCNDGTRPVIFKIEPC